MIKNSTFRLLLMLSALAAAGPGMAATMPRGPEVEEERAAVLHNDFDFETFSDHAEASQQIDFDNIDYDLLSAAVFHETNRRRVLHDLSALSYRKELRHASRIQACGMARTKAVSHRHPDAELRTLEDRLERVGLQPAFSAENVAMSFGLQYEPGRPFIPRDANGGTIFSYEPGGPAIPPHTYLSYAETLLDQWMNSPGHRQNILREEPEQLGTGHAHAENAAGMDIFYSVQVFFTALDLPAGAEAVAVPENP